MSRLEVDSVNLSFDGRTILQDIYLKCEVGEVVGLIGRNGSGKSSLLQIIFGSLKGEHQSVRVNGKYYSELLKNPSLIRFLPQHGFALDYLSFLDLIKIFNLSDHLDRIYEFEGIEKNQKLKFRALSGGQKRLMELLTVLYSKSEFALLDEPFSHLAPVMVEKVIEQLPDICAHKGIVITDHSHDYLFEASTCQYVLSNTVLRPISSRLDLENYGFFVK